MNLLLGSQSPRRRELLAGLGVSFQTVRIDSDEAWPHTLQGGEIVRYIAREKAEAYRSQLTAEDLLLTADTIVWVDGQVLGKPHDEADACRMLGLLSGRTHQVFTGVCLTTTECQEAFYDTTDVCFRPLEEAEIAYYVSRYRPLDKAGAYGIQEWIGYTGCTSLQGSYFNVMGLPTHRVAEALRRFGISVP